MTTQHRFTASLVGLSLLCMSLPIGALAQTSEENSSVSEAGSATIEEAAPLRIVPQANMPVRNDFQLGPTRFEMELSPGETRTVEVELTSRMGKPSTYTIEKEDFGPGENENEQTRLYGNLTGPYSAKDWLTSAVTKVTIEHGERVYIPVTVSVPADADPGDHYAALMAKREGAEDERTAGGIAIISRVGVLFLITVKGDVVRKGEVLSLSTPKSLYFNLTIPLSLRAKNEGTIRLYPEGTIDIKNLLGVVVDQVKVNDWIVLRNSSRSVQLTWNPTFALGRYTATTNLKLNGEATTPLSVSFWVIPLLPVLGILVAIFLVSFLVQYFFSRFEIKKK